VDRTFNKERPIENTVEVNIYFQEHKERTEIDCYDFKTLEWVRKRNLV